MEAKGGTGTLREALQHFQVGEPGSQEEFTVFSSGEESEDWCTEMTTETIKVKRGFQMGCRRDEKVPIC